MERTKIEEGYWQLERSDEERRKNYILDKERLDSLLAPIPLSQIRHEIAEYYFHSINGSQKLSAKEN